MKTDNVYLLIITVLTTILVWVLAVGSSTRAQLIFYKSYYANYTSFLDSAAKANVEYRKLLMKKDETIFNLSSKINDMCECKNND